MDTSADADAPPKEPAVELDVTFGLLKNRRRRDVLRLLEETNEKKSIGELAEHIAARECGKDVTQINSQDRKRVYVGLYQCHLPKLADVGVIEYNKPRGIIERGPKFDHIRRYLPSDESSANRETHESLLREALSHIISSGRRLL